MKLGAFSFVVRWVGWQTALMKCFDLASIFMIITAIVMTIGCDQSEEKGRRPRRRARIEATPTPGAQTQVIIHHHEHASGDD